MKHLPDAVLILKTANDGKTEKGRNTNLSFNGTIIYEEFVE